MPYSSRPPKRPDLGLPDPQLCVAFVNTGRTVPAHQRQSRGRKLPPAVRDYNTLLDWAVWKKALGGDLVQRYRQATTEEAAAVYGDALELRQLLQQVCVTISNDGAATSEQVAAVSRYLDGCRITAIPAPDGWGYVARLVVPADLATLKTWIAGSAFRMLTAGRPPVVNVCRGRECNRFVLSTKGHERVWCDTRLCVERFATKRRR